MGRGANLLPRSARRSSSVRVSISFAISNLGEIFRCAFTENFNLSF